MGVCFSLVEAVLSDGTGGSSSFNFNQFRSERLTKAPANVLQEVVLREQASPFCYKIFGGSGPQSSWQTVWFRWTLNYLLIFQARNSASCSLQNLYDCIPLDNEASGGWQTVKEKDVFLVSHKSMMVTCQ